MAGAHALHCLLVRATPHVICATSTTRAGMVECGSGCIAPLQQCCATNPSLGVTCPAATATSPAQYCDASLNVCRCQTGAPFLHSLPLRCRAGSSRAARCRAPPRPSHASPSRLWPCAAGFTMCGAACIHAATQCCLSDYTSGLQCAPGAVCTPTATGIACAAGGCPGRMGGVVGARPSGSGSVLNCLPANLPMPCCMAAVPSPGNPAISDPAPPTAGTIQCGSVCLDPAAGFCCAEAATSR